MNTEDLLAQKFVCPKCRATGAKVRKLSMSGTGLSRLFDLQYNQFAFASCQYCGYTEVYDLKLLQGSSGQGMNVLDILFGG